MKMKAIVVALPIAIIPMTVLAANTEEGYYGSAKYLQIEQRSPAVKRKSILAARPLPQGISLVTAGVPKVNIPLSRRPNIPAAPAHSLIAITT